MGKVFLFVLAFVAGLNATTLHDLEKKADELWLYDEINVKNFYIIKTNANLRTAPKIVKNNVKGRGDGKKHMLSQCKKDWCQIQSSGLWVHETQIVR